jgi:hypothetical protein
MRRIPSPSSWPKLRSEQARAMRGFRAKARRLARVGEGDDAREAAGALDLDAVVEELDADVVTTQAVGAIRRAPLPRSPPR